MVSLLPRRKGMFAGGDRARRGWLNGVDKILWWVP